MTLALDKPNTATVEHLVPKSKLPGSLPDKAKNLRATCMACNQGKADKFMWELDL